MWPYPWTHVGTPSHLGNMDRVAATMPSQAHAGAAQEAPDIGQWEGQDIPLVRPSSCNVKGGISSSRRYLPTYLSFSGPATAPAPPSLCLSSTGPPALSRPGCCLSGTHLHVHRTTACSYFVPSPLAPSVPAEHTAVCPVWPFLSLPFPASSLALPFLLPRAFAPTS